MCVFAETHSSLTVLVAALMKPGGLCTLSHGGEPSEEDVKAS